MARRIRNVSATKHSARHRPPPRTSAALPDPNRMSLLDGRCIATTHVRDGSKAVFSKVGNDFRSPPTTDMSRLLLHARFVPESDIAAQGNLAYV